MSLVWFRPTSSRGRSAAELAEHLAPFGVVLRPPLNAGCLVFRDQDDDVLVMEIGEIIVHKDGQVRVLPRRDAGEKEVRCLLGSAELALRDKPTARGGWHHTRRGGKSWWRATILVPVDDDHPLAGAFRAGQKMKDVVDRERVSAAGGDRG
jgi:hypothetical protein